MFEKALQGAADTGLSLLAVGGYGRSELAPYSDLDVVLLHDRDQALDGVAERIWYPLWDARIKLDHSVRALEEVTDAAAEDVRVALGLLDARHLAGDTALSLRLRADVLARWRRDARTNLPRLRDLVRERTAREGELAHASVPDLKESEGGLRDATVLQALVATWLVDVPHVDLERCRRQLLDLRDVLQQAAGRATDRVTPELWGELAAAVPLAEEARSPEETAQLWLRRIGRRTAHLARLTWSRVDHVLAPATPVRGRTPQLERVAPGVAVSQGEVVLDRGARPAQDPLLLLRAAVAASERRLVLAPASAARLAAESAPLPAPWPEEARDLFVRLLAGGPGLLGVWETLDETGALDLLLPEWERIRLLPHASAVHRFTVDRHAVESCVEAARLIRQVPRPDLLLVAALLHDIGKGTLGDHSVAGEPLAADVARRLGFDEEDTATVATLVRRHLLLAETATTRDLDDPATLGLVVEGVQRVEVLDLLAVLTEADARATAPKAWSTWRAGLVRELVHRVRRVLEGAEPVTHEGDRVVPAQARLGPDRLAVTVQETDHGARVTVTAADRVGLMSDVSGALAVLKLTVRSARAWTVDDVAVSVWDVAETHADAAVLSQRLEAVVSGSVDPAARLRPRPGALPPSVLVRPDASHDATVLEVRADDRLGVVHLACRALAALDLSVRSAHVATVGPQALDVFYVQEQGAAALTDERAASAAHAIREVLDGSSTLDD